MVLCGGAAGQEGRDNLALPDIPGRELAYCSVASLYSDAPAVPAYTEPTVKTGPGGAGTRRRRELQDLVDSQPLF